MLAASGISKRLGGRAVLTDISVTVSPGTITAVIGPSGSGKSTLLRAVSLIDPPESGSVLMDDTMFSFPRSLDQRIRTTLYPRMTAVFQQLFVWPHLTLRENSMLPMSLQGLNNKSLVEDLAAELGVEEVLDRYPNEVSAGQRQRVALIRALALRPAYLLLDEITSALDVEQIALVLSRLEVERAKGMGLLIVTHHLTFAERAATAVVFMDNGRVVESGEAKILREPRSDRLKRFVELGGVRFVNQGSLCNS